jgi:hypothetical protein
MPLPSQYAVPLGPGGPTPGTWYLVTCPGKTLTIYNGALVWIASTPAPTPSPSLVDPRSVAVVAARSITLPSPVIGTNPPSFGVVNLPTWLWIDASIWHRFSATATAEGVSATAVATPQSVTWSMGDGQVVVCDGSGTPYRVGVPAAGQSTSCFYTYLRSSFGQPSADGDPNDGAFPVTATITWDVSWTSTGALGGGVLPALRTTASTAIRVEQVESVGTDG